ncbi:MAG: 5'/3'-nucleotidase SurE [Planctomycetes bacterium]|nr:5'/3'-nucleotidase SurE [Planctomycetota bacterium]
MKILLTCDDGICSKGIQTLKDQLKKLGKIYIVAPADQKSAVSHGITLYDPLIVEKIAIPGVEMSYSVNGTPADCVKLAITSILPFTPDIVVSGINKGLNAGSNILYSGTVAAALEASLFQITSFAVSMQDTGTKRKDIVKGASIAKRIITSLYRRHKRTSIVFNINIPLSSARRYKGFVLARQESIPNEDNYHRRIDPRGRVYYWLGGDRITRIVRRVDKRGVTEFPSDVMVVHNGYVSVTPLKRDFTYYEVLRELNHES